jgi:hypothetical protein
MVLNRFAPPKVLGHLPETVLADISSVFPNQVMGTEWRKHPQPFTKPYQPELMEALQPLHDLIMQAMFGNWQLKPEAIFYSVDTRKVEPDESQRSGSWHIDNEGAFPPVGIIVADANPTEFLIHKSRMDFKHATKRRRLGKSTLGSIYRELTEEEMDDLGLLVYRPSPFELVAFQGQVHRSPMNSSEEAITRTWVRAAVLHYRHLKKKRV